MTARERLNLYATSLEDAHPDSTIDDALIEHEERQDDFEQEADDESASCWAETIVLHFDSAREFAECIMADLEARKAERRARKRAQERISKEYVSESIHRREKLDRRHAKR